MNRGRFLVNMVEERDKENISPNLLTQPDTRQEFEPIIQKETVVVNRSQLEDDREMSLSDEDSSNETHAALSVDDKSIPSTSKQQQTSTPHYYISPIQSDQSDFDDSGEDPSFQLINKSKTLFKIVPFGSLLSSSSTSNSRSKSSSRSNSLSDTEDDSAHLQLDPQNTKVAEINSQELVIEEKKGKKRIRKPTMWKSKIAKVLRNSGKAYQSMSKSKLQVPERKVSLPCGEKCRLKCKDKINEISRQQLFDAFWGIGNLERQREFIVRHSQKIKPKYQYSSTQDIQH
ncbi:unnamed protein product [Parnassius apollo]|uniref:(apollo) hypothetical protein n=1 Tax=Parnassius apollo TaxID=110799 RepID=A0A8S3XI63_PARAO|nr:unnamed protein product [Parnassius apollo]